jgi:hypothetical protein
VKRGSKESTDNVRSLDIGTTENSISGLIAALIKRKQFNSGTNGNIDCNCSTLLFLTPVKVNDRR